MIKEFDSKTYYILLKRTKHVCYYSLIFGSHHVFCYFVVIQGARYVHAGPAHSPPNKVRSHRKYSVQLTPFFLFFYK